jgi:hypothetical protein
MDETNSQENKCKPRRSKMGKGACGGVYFVAFIGAAIYFLQNSHTFWAGVLGFLKACVWPALLVYKLLQFLQIR